MQKKQHSMKWKVIRILLLCWLIPFFFLIAVLGIYLVNNHSGQTAERYRSQLEFSDRICVERLNRVVADSRQASYDGDILKARRQYLEGTLSYENAQQQYKQYLYDQYEHSDAISSVILWFEGEGEAGSASVYSESGNGSYQQIRGYWANDHAAVTELVQKLDTSVGFLVRSGKLYMVRNMMDSRYQVQAVLVFCLNQDYCFNSISRYPMQDDACVWIDDQEPLLCGEEEADEWQERYDGAGESGYRWIGGQLCVTDSRAGDRYRIRSAMLIEKNVTRFPFYGYPYVVAGMVGSVILMLLAVLWVFSREVTHPVTVLSEGVRHIEEGELGYQISEGMENQEFAYLTEAVNRMSDHLKRQFNRIYQEEIALREARIMALQSHINPHFLNNTMETINWEARLEGNVKISKMIEALSRVMDAAMDRRKRPEVPLAEEMAYVNSYLYIMKERLGKRLTVEIDMPPELMNGLVPRLILQPVIENAIEHGIVPNGSGTVLIRGFRDGENLILDTYNNGGLTQEDRNRIARLLDLNYNTSKEPAGNLGIANVHQRLHILFGEPYGLTIREEGVQVLARLTMPWRENRYCSLREQ